MFAAKVPGRVHKLDGVERAAARPRGSSSVRRSAMKVILNRNQAAIIRRLSKGRSQIVAHMAAEHYVNILEKPGANKERLGAHQFLSDTGKDLQGAGQMVLF